MLKGYLTLVFLSGRKLLQGAVKSNKLLRLKRDVDLRYDVTKTNGGLFY